MNKQGFWLLTTADCASTLGSQAGWLASLWCAAGLERGALWTGVLSVAAGTSSAVASALAGPLLHRLPTKKVIVCANLVLACLSVVLASLQLAAAPVVTWALVLVCAGLLGPFTQLGWMVLLPLLVEDSELAKANSYSELAFQATALMAPVVASVMISTFGPQSALFLDALTFCFAAVLVSRLSVANRLAAQKSRRFYAAWFSDLQTGGKWLLGNRTVLSLSLLACLMMFGYGIEDVTYPVLIRNQLRGPASWLGVLLGSYAVGLGMGALLYARFGHRVHIAKIPVGFVALWALCLALFIMPSGISRFSVLTGFAGLAFGTFPPLVRSTVQALVPKEYHGSVFGLRSMMMTLAVPAGGFVASHMMGTIHMPPSSVISWLGIGCLGLISLITLMSRMKPRVANKKL